MVILLYPIGYKNYADRFLFPNPIDFSELGNRIITDVMLSRNREQACQVGTVADIAGAFVGFDVIPPCIRRNIDQVEPIALVGRKHDLPGL